MSERFARIDAFRVCSDRAAKREIRLGFLAGGCSIAAAQHRTACDKGNLGGIVVLFLRSRLLRSSRENIGSREFAGGALPVDQCPSIFKVGPVTWAELCWGWPNLNENDCSA